MGHKRGFSLCIEETFKLKQSSLQRSQHTSYAGQVTNLSLYPAKSRGDDRSVTHDTAPGLMRVLTKYPSRANQTESREREGQLGEYSITEEDGDNMIKSDTDPEKIEFCRVLLS